jgi:hypothetical protein
VGRKRFVANGGQNTAAARYLALDLHTDGGGGMAMQLSNLSSVGWRSVTEHGDASHVMGDEAITQVLVSALFWLAPAARDSGAGGTVLIRATLVPPRDKGVEIGQTRWHGLAENISQVRLLGDIPPAAGAALLDDLAEPGQPLLRVARDLAGQLGQSFGIPEMMQITADGSLRAPYWHGGETNPVCQWALSTGIPVIDPP